MSRTIIPAPSRDQMPSARNDSRSEIAVELEVVTLIYGGSVVPREVDLVDVIRAPSVRGHLRFWWRALYAHTMTSKELYRRESELWGGPTRSGADFEKIGRSRVELTVDVHHEAKDSSYEPEPVRGRDPKEISAPRAARNYALFPAREQRSSGIPAAKLRDRGTRFALQLRVPEEHHQEVRAAVTAWILFGGYGGRTRRGLGSLTVIDKPELWLPTGQGYQAILKQIDPDLSNQQPAAVAQTPSLVGAQMFETYEMSSSVDAWSKAMGWLRDFRQGSESRDGARRPAHGEDKGRPSISNWPEADKVRRFSKPGRYPWAHPPRHNGAPSWPRAGFGLPIIGQFQSKSRERKPWAQCSPPTCEPEDFRIGWQQGGQTRDRLASPVILKPLALANGRFRPIALWLNRAHPEGKVILQRSNGEAVRHTEVPFDQFLAPDDEVYFAALEGKSSLEEAFFAWLEANAKPEQSRGTATKRKNRRNR